MDCVGGLKMKFSKRSLISIYRKPIKSSIFLILVILLGILSAGSILVQQAIVTADQNLRRRMPAVSTIMQHVDEDIYEQTGEWPAFEVLNPDLIHQVGAFPQVKSFDYAITIQRGVTISGFSLWDDPDFFFTLSFDYDDDLGVHVSVEGVHHADFLDVRDQFIELVSGRSFEEEEFVVSHSPYPVLVASGFAQENELSIGSTFEAQVVVFYETNIQDMPIIEHRDKPPVVEETFVLEVIGIFDHIFPTLPADADFDDTLQAHVFQSVMQHRLFLPNDVVERMFEARVQSAMLPDNIFITNFFLLNDPLDFEAFALEVENLPGSWRAINFSSGFRRISTAMESMQEIADFVFLGATGATLLITMLLVLLFLNDRKHEIGIYLALGEKRLKIILQMLLELMPLAVIGITIALFLGNILATEMSQEFLRQSLEENRTEFLMSDGSNVLKYFGYRFELQPEEMLENYEVNMSLETVVFFYFIGLGTIFIATLIPIWHTTKIAPKKILN